jgi:DUF917 family protein
MILDEKFLKRIIEGCAFLGSGGGGSLKAAGKFLDVILNSPNQVELISSPDELLGKKHACIVCDIGSISSFDDKQDEALVYAFEQLVDFHKFDIAAVFPIETGPENTLAACVIAAKYGIPVIDGDGAGRAVPTLPLSTFSIAGIEHWQPLCISNGNGDVILLKTPEKKGLDGLARSVSHLEQFNNSASMALWPDTVEKLHAGSVKGSITRALHCGQLIEGIRVGDESLIGASLPEVNKINAWMITQGKLVSKVTREENGFNFTTTKLEDSISKRMITIISQNESLLVYDEGKDGPIALGPDSICYLWDDFSVATNTEITKKDVGGVRILYIIGVEAHPKLLECKEILDGFKEIIFELGYPGSQSIKNQKQPLGDLMIDLYKKRNKQNDK